MGTAAYLNVFGSIYKVLQDLKQQGYTVDGVPEQEEDLIKLVSSTALTPAMCFCLQKTENLTPAPLLFAPLVCLFMFFGGTALQDTIKTFLLQAPPMCQIN